MDGIGFLHAEEKGRKFLERIKGKEFSSALVLGNTETAKIPGISAAGANPGITDFTPAADAELLLTGRCESIDGVPVTPDGIPTPALITMSALQLIEAPIFVIEGGLNVKPKVPYVSLGGIAGKDIRGGRALEGAADIIKRGKMFGTALARTADFLVLGESIVGGTTTALGVLTAMGIEARVSSSMPENPMELKRRVVEKGMKNAGIRFGDLKSDPTAAVEALGDPMLPALAGCAIGAARHVLVLLAGGTQMTAALAVIAGLGENLENIAIGTTRWVAGDGSSDISGIVKQIEDVPIVYPNLSFEDSIFPGLRAYEEGVVKEGVGAGGISAAASLNGVPMDKLIKRVEENYTKLVSGRG